MELLNDNNLNDENLKKAPYDDDLFLDIIIQKEDNDSKYLKDLQKVKYALENLKTCIEEDGDIQRFNANVNVVELYVKNLSEKYKNEPESQKESFISILNTNYYAKVLGNLKYEANYYKRLIPTNLGQYSSQNISLEEQKLLNRINKALFEINNET